MHHITSLLILLLLSLIFYYSIEGMVNMYDWRHPVFDKQVKAKDLEIERDEAFPSGYSSVPVLDSTPIKLEDVNKMFETNVNTNKYSTILDKLNNIEDELLLSRSKYTCTNITGEDSDNPNDNEIYQCPNNKILTVGVLQERCGESGCSTEECCSDKPTDTEIRYYHVANQCVQVASTENDSSLYYGGSGMSLEDAKTLCENEHTMCIDLRPIVTDGVTADDGTTTNNLCLEDGKNFDVTKMCDNSNALTNELLQDGDARINHDCYDKCC
jgi:hypothetical protein